MSRLKTQASLDKLEEVQDFIGRQLEAYGVTAKAMLQIQLAVEEMFVNIAHYAYAPKSGEAVVECEQDEDMVRITLTDWGVPFNPLTKEDADITLSAEERPIGGLGIFMVKKFMDRLDYRYEDGKNIFSMWAAKKEG